MIFVLARYRYRIDPTPGQREMLARTFGCVRVVFNDAIRAREAAYSAAEKITPTEVQRRVITQAKGTDERAWLGEVASVALVQSVRDAHKAYANFFVSITGKREGRCAGRPRMKSRKDARQSFRLTRNGFALRPNGRLYLAKIGEVQVRWSRELPSVPSSVTVIREPDDHYYASFVVEVDPTPLPEVNREAGVDLGLSRLATVATSDGSRTDVPNPRHLAGKLRKLARLEREKARRAKGSNRRAKTRLKVAKQHATVRRTRLDHHHKLALGLVRENQAVHVEDLNVVGLARNRQLARSISDAGWSILVRLLREKAERYGRTVHMVDRWLASSKTCADCGRRMTELSLQVRTWTCPGCAVVHDRDHNAARVILAAGRAERQNARGAHVRPRRGAAEGVEAGSTPDAA
ncbi:transposase [Longimycelium tulufanense]|uniref:Transposase n=1 Tax=Longimycelium tulufanense TaxID=907463 RepID=A0A8J3FWH6_9PSEU|nr:transposase [Longimycelium tulufanense]GGM66551.1 transposase [Longimycelium tulufanense]